MKKSGKIIATLLILLLFFGGIGGGIFYLSYIENIGISNGENGVLIMEIADEELLGIEFPKKIYLNKKVSFASNNDSVASVDSNGKIKAKSVGEATITATTEWYKRSSSIKVVVKYGKPDEISVEVAQNQKQYSDEEIAPIAFKATSFKGGFESQDPDKVSFKWVIKEGDAVVKEEIVSVNTYEYTPSDNSAKKITAECILMYENAVITSDKAKDIAEANIFDKITENDFYIYIITTLTGDKAYIGKVLEVGVKFTNAKVDSSLIPSWNVEFNNKTDSLISGQKTRFTPENIGDYTISSTITEKGNNITKNITIATQYQEVSELSFNIDRKIFSPEEIEAFEVKISWNKYSNPTQNVELTIKGKDSSHSEIDNIISVSGDNGYALMSVDFDISGNDIFIKVNGTDTGIVISKDNLYSVEVYAKIGSVKATNSFVLRISSGEVQSIRVATSTDMVFDDEENDSILSRNNINKQFKVGAKFYPKMSNTEIVWYVNNVKQTKTANFLEFTGENVGEYHIYCESKDGNLRSNVVSVPSANNIPTDSLEHLGDYNGRSVNRYVTCQSDIDALMEYAFVKNKYTIYNVYIDTIMQDMWSSYNTIFEGEKYWINYGKNYYYVNSSGNITDEVPSFSHEGKVAQKCDSISRAFYRLAYSGSFSGYILTKDQLNKMTNLTFKIIPTNQPTKVSTQVEYEQKNGLNTSKPYKPISDNYRHFAIDEIEETVEVSTSSELYDAVENGYRPICKDGSVAKEIYLQAREVLTRYVTDDMSDLEKAKFIYQWIIYEVTYDYEAVKDNGADINTTMQYSAYYLEGVFGLSGKFNKQIAVCDGRSKAYVLMCKIEGIQAIRVTGTCYQNGNFAGGHAWNKVYIRTTPKGEPHWYVVDTTWGDIKQERFGQTYEEYVESQFLMTDDQHNNSSSYECIEDESVYKVPIANTPYYGTYNVKNSAYTEIYGQNVA